MSDKEKLEKIVALMNEAVSVAKTIKSTDGYAGVLAISYYLHGKSFGDKYEVAIHVNNDLFVDGALEPDKVKDFDNDYYDKETSTEINGAYVFSVSKDKEAK